jgi:hypothetical protein
MGGAVQSPPDGGPGDQGHGIALVSRRSANLFDWKVLGEVGEFGRTVSRRHPRVAMHRGMPKKPTR